MNWRYLTVLLFVLAGASFGCASTHDTDAGGGENPAPTLRASPPDATEPEDDKAMYIVAYGEMTCEPGNDVGVLTIDKHDCTCNTLALSADEPSVRLYDVRVIYANGEVFVPKETSYYRDESRTYYIVLPADKRVIKRVEYRYRNAPEGKKVRFELWGK